MKNNLLGFIGKLAFYAMTIVLLVLMANYTMSFVARIFPDDWIKQWGSLVLFDVGAVTWFVLFLLVAEGVGQRGTSLVGGVVDLLGGIILAGAEVFGAGVSVTNDAAMSAWLGEVATWVLFIWLGVNIALTWLFHIVAPGTQQDMAIRNIQDDATAKALKMAENKVNAVAAQIADELSDSVYMNAMAQLGITNPSLMKAPRPMLEDKTGEVGKNRQTVKDWILDRMPHGVDIPVVKPEEAEPATSNNGVKVEGGPGPT